MTSPPTLMTYVPRGSQSDCQAVMNMVASVMNHLGQQDAWNKLKILFAALIELCQHTLENQVTANVDRKKDMKQKE
eukprot:14369482-Ditylum_brightwellii.AAC.1